MSEDKKGTIPTTNSDRWKKNEKLIARDPTLRRVRDIQQGLNPTSGITTAGDISEEYKNNYDKIDFTKKDPDAPRNFRVKINGKYVDESDD
jgi:hypothetical protein